LKIFVYEHLSGGGLLAASANRLGLDAATQSLLREGSAMRNALLMDLAETAGVQASALVDTRTIAKGAPSVAPTHAIDSVGVADFKQWEAAFDRLARDADAAIVIAPESTGQLEQLARRVISLGTPLLGPSLELIALTSNKQGTADYLTAYNIPVPRGFLLPAGASLSDRANFPLVRKPNDGCGSMQVDLVQHREQEGAHRLAPCDERVEAYCAGQPASVALISGPQGFIVMPACGQRLTNDGRFTYLGGYSPLEPETDARARNLGTAVGEALPKFVGYLGIDLVLGDAADGSQDVVIEVNPRLTTSYVGLRQMVQPTPAEIMVRAFLGQPLDWSNTGRSIEFDADGTIRDLP